MNYCAALFLALLASFHSNDTRAHVDGAVVESGVVPLAKTAVRAVQNSLSTVDKAISIVNIYLTTSRPIMKAEIDALANDAGANAAVQTNTDELKNIFDYLATDFSAYVYAYSDNGFINADGLRRIDEYLKKSNAKLNKAVAELKVAADGSGLNAAVVVTGVESTQKVNTSLLDKIA